ncbi:hypothetical protein D3C81_1935400 [compost metagenome]
MMMSRATLTRLPVCTSKIGWASSVRSWFPEANMQSSPMVTAAISLASMKQWAVQVTLWPMTTRLPCPIRTSPLKALSQSLRPSSK